MVNLGLFLFGRLVLQFMAVRFPMHIMHQAARQQRSEMQPMQLNATVNFTGGKPKTQWWIVHVDVTIIEGY